MTRSQLFTSIETHLIRCGEEPETADALAEVVVDAAYILARLNADGSGRSPADYVIEWTRKPQEKGATS